MNLLQSLLSAVGSSLNQALEFSIDLASPIIDPPADDSLDERFQFLYCFFIMVTTFPSVALFFSFMAYVGSTELIRFIHLLLVEWRETKELTDANNPGPKLFCAFVVCLFFTVMLTILAIPAYICAGGFFLTVRVLEISGYAKPDTKEKPSVVTRQMVDTYRYNAFSRVDNFYYTSSSHSFCQVIHFKQLVQMQKSHQLANVSSPVTEETCCICTDGFEDLQKILLLPCGHFYHFGCILKHKLAKSQKGRSTSQQRSFKCMICQLDLLRHFLFYREQNWDPKEVPFRNR